MSQLTSIGTRFGIFVDSFLLWRFLPKKSNPSQKPVKGGNEPDIPLITAKKCGSSNRPEIPDFLIVEPSEQEKRLQAEKMELLNKLKPTEDSVQEVCYHGQILQCPKG